MNLVLFKALVKLHFVTPLGFLRLIYCFIREGLTLMSILRFTRYYYKHDIAFVSEGEKISYGVILIGYPLDEGVENAVWYRRGDESRSFV